VDQEFLLIQMTENPEETKIRQIKHIMTPSTGEMSHFSQDMGRLTLRRASSLKNEDDEINESPSPRLKCVLNLKKNTKILNGPKYAQFSLFYHEKLKVDKLNHNVSYQIPNKVYHERMILSLNNTNIVTFLKSQKEDKIYAISNIFVII